MFTTIILGAGKSTRMKANKSKLLFDIADLNKDYNKIKNLLK